MKPAAEITDLAYHRNGIAGDGFHVAIVQHWERHNDRFVVVYFGGMTIAALDIDKLAAGDIKFGSNSWRGDRFEPLMRGAVADDEAA